ncbi:hypothetical protein PCANC_25852 [Puccinia coronata f. sp. avenae]|uniref:Uncharacterized protein n=1 Tax=Puccinia coronata f. sp. avenae TaxID=200324 RepID=A0A2N5S1R1_9BASI|nr:hypothetical protein PCANC_25852 [Puccinia coronata f. sp. avenae]
MGARASSGRFVLQAPVGRFLKASSGRYLTEAPVGRYHKAFSGRLCQVAPIGRFQSALIQAKPLTGAAALKQSKQEDQERQNSRSFYIISDPYESLRPLLSNSPTRSLRRRVE